MALMQNRPSNLFLKLNLSQTKKMADQADVLAQINPVQMELCGAD